MSDRVAGRLRRVLAMVSGALLLTITAASVGNAELPVASHSTDVGGVVHSVAVDNTRDLAYVTVPERNVVASVSLASGGVQSEFEVPGSPKAVAMTADDSSLYIGLGSTAAVVSVDLETGDRRTFDLAAATGAITTREVVRGTGDFMWVATDSGGARINTLTGAVEANEGWGTQVVAGQKYIYYAQPSHSPESVRPVSADDGRYLWMTHLDDGGSEFMAVSPDDLQITLRHGARLDAQTLRPTGRYSAYGLPLYTPDGKYIYFAWWHDAGVNAIAVHDAMTMQRYDTITTGCPGSEPHDASLTAQGSVVMASGSRVCVAAPPVPFPKCQGEDVTTFGTPGDDRILSRASTAVISGGDGNDVIDAYGGNALVCGGAGNDSIQFHFGENSFDGEAGTDEVDYTRAYGHSGLNTGVSVHLAAGMGSTANGIDELTSIENVKGSPRSDILIGDGGNNRLLGQEGDDVLVGREGDDVFGGGWGGDTVSFTDAEAGVEVNLANGTVHGEGDDSIAEVETVLGSEFADSLSGGPLSDVLRGNGGPDRIRGAAGNDTLSGGEGDDAIGPGAGDDVVDGGTGFDLLDLRTAGQAVHVDLRTTQATGEGVDQTAGFQAALGSSFDDVLVGTGSVNRLLGGAGKDVLRGLGGDDRIFGGRGADLLYGHAGNDLIDGDHGWDTVEGGRGIDDCRSAERVRSCE